MKDLQAFWKRVRELYRRATPFDDGRKPTQNDLADAIRLGRAELSNRLNVDNKKGAKLTEANVRAIVRTLVEWEAISTQAEVQELLDMVGCPDFTPAEWRSPPLDMLLPNPSPSQNGHRSHVPVPLPNGYLPLEPEAPLHNLPAALTSFIAREQEINYVIARLRSGPDQTRLLTLTGAGGCGKTRLAVEAATRLVPCYPAGVWLIELADLRDPALVPQAVARVVKVREVPGESLLDTLACKLANKTMLLVLDNCEHLIDAVAMLVHKLLPACAHLQILATSRERLRTRGEAVWGVPPLALPAQSGTFSPAQLLEYAAIQLFVARARAVAATFTLTPGNATAVWTICRRLDGIPLAIELAAACVGDMSPAQIQQRLDDRFALLPEGNRTDLPRQQTLKAMVDWSYALLKGDAPKTLFRRLAVFAGGFTLEAAETVCASDGVAPAQVGEVLFTLIDKSLVLKEEHDDTTRYRLQETLRQYGAKLLSEEETADLRRRHLAWFLALAEQVAPWLRGPEQKRWLDRLEIEHDNLRAALAWSTEAPEHAEEGLRLSCALREFWERRDYLSEGRRWLDELLDHSDSAMACWRGRALYAAGNLACAQDDNQGALELLEECLALRRTRDNPRRVGYALDSLGRVLIHLGEYEQARLYLEESLDLKRRLGDEEEMVLPLFQLGRVTHYQGNYAQARKLLWEAESRSRAAQNDQWLSAILYELGTVYEDEGQYDRADVLLEQSLEIASALDERGQIGRLLYAQGHVAYRLKDYSRAQARYQQSLDLVQEQAHRVEIAHGCYGLGVLAQESGQFEKAVALYRKSLSLSYSLSDKRLLAHLLEALGGLAASQQEFGTAAQLLGAAAQLRQRLGAPLQPADQRAHEQIINTICAALGPLRFDQEQRAWSGLPLDRVVQEALGYAV